MNHKYRHGIVPELDFAFKKTFGPDIWHRFYVVFLSKKHSVTTNIFHSQKTLKYIFKILYCKTCSNPLTLARFQKRKKYTAAKIMFNDHHLINLF